VLERLVAGLWCTRCGADPQSVLPAVWDVRRQRLWIRVLAESSHTHGMGERVPRLLACASAAGCVELTWFALRHQGLCDDQGGDPMLKSSWSTPRGHVTLVPRPGAAVTLQPGARTMALEQAVRGRHFDIVRLLTSEDDTLSRFESYGAEDPASRFSGLCVALELGLVAMAANLIHQSPRIFLSVLQLLVAVDCIEQHAGSTTSTAHTVCALRQLIRGSALSNQGRFFEPDHECRLQTLAVREELQPGVVRMRWFAEPHADTRLWYCDTLRCLRAVYAVFAGDEHDWFRQAALQTMAIGAVWHGDERVLAVLLGELRQRRHCPDYQPHRRFLDHLCSVASREMDRHGCKKQRDLIEQHAQALGVRRCRLTNTDLARFV